MAGTLLFIGSLGPWEILIILVLALLLFGGRKIPQLARDLGSGIREFRKTLSGSANEIEDNLDMDSMDEPDKRTTSKSKSKKRPRNA